MRPDPEKLSAVRDYTTPICKKQVRAFLGLAGYYCRFVPHFQPLLSHLLNSQKVEIQIESSGLMIVKWHFQDQGNPCGSPST